MIELVKFDCADYDRLISWVHTPEELMQFAGPAFSFPLTKEQLDISLGDIHRHAYKVIHRNTGEIIAHAEIYLNDTSAYLGRILIGVKQMRGLGIGKMIIEKLLEIAFKEFDRSLVQLNVFDWNIQAIKCYEKAGFIINPDKRSTRHINGETWTALNMVFNHPFPELKS